MLRNALLTFVSGVVMVIVGYKLNDFMSRDRLTVEYVQFKPQTESLPPKIELADKLSKNSQFRQWCGRPSLFSECDVLLGQKTARKWDAPVVQHLKQYLEGFTDHVQHELSELDQATTAISKSPRGSDIGSLVAAIQPHLGPDAPASILRATSEEDRRKVLIEAIKSATESDKEAAKLSRQILDYLRLYKPERTGELDMWITVLNSGDTDGLIRPEGYLTLNDGTDKQPIKLVEMEPFSNHIGEITSSAKSIQKRSATTLVFRLSPKILADPPRTQIINSIKKRPDLRGNVELRDIRNSPVGTKKEFSFPPDGAESPDN